MSIKFATGFEGQSLHEAGWTSAGSVSIQNTTSRNSGYALKIDRSVSSETANSATFTFPWGAISEIYFSGWFYHDINEGDYSSNFFKFRSTTNDVLRLWNDGRSSLNIVYVGPQTLQTPYCFRRSTWTLFEVYLKLDNSVGRLVIKANGVTWIDFTGDTLGSYSTFDNILFPCYRCTASGSFYWDDVVMIIPDGTTPETYSGGPDIYGLLPTADAGTNQWTPSTGVNHFAVVDDRPPSATDNLKASVSGYKELFTLANLPASGVGSVYGYRLWTHAQKTYLSIFDPGYVKLGLKMGGVEYKSDSLKPTDDAASTFLTLYQYGNPAGGGFSKTDIDNAEFVLEAV